MNSRERCLATIRGEPVDRVAVALWRHFPIDDRRPTELAASTLAWQREYDWDFVKVSPSSDFCLVDWGVRSEWVGGNEGSREYTHAVVHQPEDWARLPLQAPNDGALGGQLRCLELISAGLGTEVPFIQTIFSPLAQAKNLASRSQLLVHMRRTPELVHAGLETITQTTIRFVEACLTRGIAGIYYAVQLATFQSMSEPEYREFGEPYDRRILAAASGCWFSLLHQHGTDVMFDLTADYPVHALNWHDRESGPSLAEGARRFPGAVCGGLEHWQDLLRAEPEQVEAQIADAIAQTGGRRLIVASGCVAPVNAPFCNLRATRAAVERTS